MGANGLFRASVRAAYGVNAQYVVNSVACDPNDETDFAAFTGKCVKFYVAASGDTTVPNAVHVDDVQSKIAPYATTSIDVDGTSHLDTKQFKGTDLVTFFSAYV